MRQNHTKRLLEVIKSKLITPLRETRNVSGQSMVEYALIAILVVIAIGATIVLTKPAIGNIFSNTVYNLVGQTTTPYTPPDAAQLNTYATAFENRPTPKPLKTNTPAAPTCSVGPATRLYMVPNPAATGVWWTPTPSC